MANNQQNDQDQGPVQWGLPTQFGALPSNLASQPQPMPQDLQQSLSQAQGSGQSLGPVPATVAQIAKKEGVDPNLLYAMIHQESGGQNGQTSNKGAQGLMQLLPGTFNDVMQGQGNIWNPVDNITAGARYLKQQLNTFGGNLPLALAAYNAGPGAVQKAGNKVPNYAETQNYVKSILGKYQASQASTGQDQNSSNPTPSPADSGSNKPIDNAPTWKQITEMPKYQNASDADKEAVRNAYFEQVIAPHLDADQIAAARQQFNDATVPSTWQKIKNAAGNLVDDAGSAIKSTAQALTSGNLGKDIVQNQQANTETDEQAANPQLPAMPSASAGNPNTIPGSVTNGMNGQEPQGTEILGMPNRPVAMDATAWSNMVTHVRANPQAAQADAAKINQIPEAQRTFDQRAFLTAVQTVTGQNQQILQGAKDGQPNLTLADQISQSGVGNDPATVATQRLAQLNPDYVNSDVEQQALQRAQGEYAVNQAGIQDPGQDGMVLHYSNGQDATLSDLDKIQAQQHAENLANHPVTAAIANASPLIGDMVKGTAEFAGGVLDAATLGLNLVAQPIDKFASLMGVPVDGDHPAFARSGLAQDMDQVADAAKSKISSQPFDAMKTAGDKAEWIAHQIAGQPIQNLMMLAGGIMPQIAKVMAGAMAAQAAGSSYAHDLNTDATLPQALSDAVVNGATMYLGEMLPLHVAHEIPGYIAKLTADQRASFLGNILRKTGIALGAVTAQAASGSANMAAAQIVQNWSKKNILGQQDVNLLDGVKDAAIIGAATETSLGAKHAIDVARSSPLNSEVRAYKAAQEARKWQAFQRYADLWDAYRQAKNNAPAPEPEQNQATDANNTATLHAVSIPGNQQQDENSTEGLNVPTGAVPASQVLDSEQAGEPSAPVDSPAQTQQQQQSEPPVTHPAIQVGHVESNVVTPGGMEAKTHFAVVDASHLTTSHNEDLVENPNYPQELQPRDRSKMTSDLQINRIMRGLDPAQLGDSRLSDTGAPIVTPEGVVLSGNGRTIALARAYNGNKGEGYRDWLVENAEHFGVDPQAVQKMTAPVLVRVAGDLPDPVEFARQSNESAKASMGDHEQAQADANRLTDLSNLKVSDNGDISSNLGDSFNQQFLRQVVPANEHGDMITENKAAGTKTLSAKGLRRIRNAIMARAYGSHDVVRQMMESLNEGHKNITTALMQVAPRIAKMRDAMRAQPFPALDPSLDVTDQLIQALSVLNHLRSQPNGPSVREWLAQHDIMTEHDPLVDQLVEGLDSLKSAKQIRTFLSAYVDAVESIGSPHQGDLIGGDKPDLQAILREAQQRANPNAEQADIFSQRPGQSADQSGQSTERPGEPAAGSASTEQSGGRAGKQPRQPRTDESQSNGGAPVRPQESEGQLTPDATAKDKFNQEQAQADLDAALGDLGDILGDFVGTKKLLPNEARQKLLPVLTRLMDAAFRLGYYKFKANAKYTLDYIKSKLGEEHAKLLTLDDLQSAYIGMAQHYQEEGADSKKDVINNYDTLDDVLKEEPGQQAQPGGKSGKPQSKAEEGYPQPHSYLTYERNGEPVGQYHHAGETAWEYNKNHAEGRVHVLQIGKDKWIGGTTVRIMQGKETQWGHSGPLQDRLVFKTREEARAHYLEELRKSAHQLSQQDVDGKYTTEQGVMRGRMMAEAAAKEQGNATEQAPAGEGKKKPHEMPLAEYLKTPESTNVPKGHILNADLDKTSDEDLMKRSKEELRQLAHVVGTSMNGSKSELLQKIRATWEIRKALSKATVESLQELPKQELARMMGVVKEGGSYLNKEGAAKTLIAWRDTVRAKGSRSIGESKHEAFVNRAMKNGEQVPYNVLKDYPHHVVENYERDTPEYKKAVHDLANQWTHSEPSGYVGTALAVHDLAQEPKHKESGWAPIYQDVHDHIHNDMMDEGQREEYQKRLAERPKLKITRFVSGLSRLKDFFAGRHGGEPIGVDVGELGKQPYKDWYTDAMLDDGGDNPGAHQGWTNTGRESGIVEVGKAVLHGHDVFVDSGAYGIFQSNMKRKENPQHQLGEGWGDLALDFNQVMKRYEDIINAIHTENGVEDPVEWGRLHLVMPDVIGNQAETMELWAKHLSDIRTFLPIRGEKWSMNRDVDAIVPLQKGAMSLADLYQHAVDLFGTDQFRVGIPSNAEAISPADLAEFIAKVNPEKIHFLGVASPETLNPLIDVIKKYGKGNIDITADSTLMRKHLDEITNRVAKGESRHNVIRDIIKRENINKEPEEAGQQPEPQQPQAKKQDLVDKFYLRIKNDQMPRDNRELKEQIARHLGKSVDEVTDLDLKKGQEALETAISKRAGEIAKMPLKQGEIFDRLLDLYQKQPNLNVRTSDSMAHQAYSTPAPLAFLAGRLARIEPTSHVYDPTAGNGMLVINADPKHVIANELQQDRVNNLNKLGFEVVHGNALDAVKDGIVPAGSQDAVMMNPPFGALDEPTNVDGYKISKLDHQIVLESLKAMKDNGHAIIIVGANKNAGELTTADRIFLNAVYSNYRVKGHFEVDGKLYSRQGASWPIRVLVIDGREKTGEFSPASGEVPRFDTWDKVYGEYNRLNQLLDSKDEESTQNGSRSPENTEGGETGTTGNPAAHGGEDQQPHEQENGSDATTAGQPDSTRGSGRNDAGASTGGHDADGHATEPGRGGDGNPEHGNAPAGDRGAENDEPGHDTASGPGHVTVNDVDKLDSDALDDILDEAENELHEEGQQKQEAGEADMVHSFPESKDGSVEDTAAYHRAVIARLRQLHSDGRRKTENKAEVEQIMRDYIEKFGVRNWFKLDNHVDASTPKPAWQPEFTHPITDKPGNEVNWLDHNVHFQIEVAGKPVDVYYNAHTKYSTNSYPTDLKDDYSHVQFYFQGEDWRGHMGSSEMLMRAMRDFKNPLELAEHLANEKFAKGEYKGQNANKESIYEKHSKRVRVAADGTIHAEPEEGPRPAEFMTGKERNPKSNQEEETGNDWQASDEMATLDHIMRDMPPDDVSFSVAPDMDPKFSHDFYAKFKQAVARVWEKAKAAGTALKDFAKAIMARYGARVRPYLKQFILDQSKATQTPQAKDKNYDPQSPTGENKPRDEAVANEFQVPYTPRSKSPIDAILIPVNQAAPMQDALDAIERQHPAGIDDYVVKELGYNDAGDLFKALNGVQVDSVAMAIHQLKQGKALIIGDQTGIGKGRQAAAIIRWAHKNGHIPVFFTVKDNLFSDMVNDLHAIGSSDLVPFITNAGAKIINDEDDSVRYQMKPNEQSRIIREMANTGELPKGSHMLFSTYSQINTPGAKIDALRAIAPKAIFILDESHNAGGDSNTSRNMTSFLQEAKGAAYLSATFAKRPDNLPIYFKTDIQKATGDLHGLIDAMQRGGTKLQLVVSRMLTQAGQMVRRERSYDGVEIRSVMDEANKDRDVRLADATTNVLRQIVSISKDFDRQALPALKDDAKKNGITIGSGKNAVHTTVDHSNFAAVVHNYVKQLLLGIKAETTVQHAVEALKAGQKPVIALENTMESFLQDYAQQNGINPGEALPNFGWNSVLKKALDGTRRYKVTDPHGNESTHTLSYDEMPAPLAAQYRRMERAIEEYGKTVTDGIPVSPIDYIRQRIEDEGQKLFDRGEIEEPWKMSEITGRNMTVDYSDMKNPTLQQRDANEKKAKKVIVNKFNRGELHGLVLNVSGSTGLSIHASEKYADQRQRHMIIAQPSADIAIFMQMLGRIHRTGQVRLPMYTILSSALASEKRPTMVLAGKMKSLNANTSTNKDSATSIKSVDFFNKYGDRTVVQWLHDNWDEAGYLNIPLPEDPDEATEDFARKVSGKLSLLPVADQERFYREVEQQYQEYYDMRSAMGTNELEQRALDLDAKPRGEPIKLTDPVDDTVFGQGSTIQKFDVKRAGKPPKPDEVEQMIKDGLGEHANYADLMNNEVLPPVKEGYERNQQDLADRIASAQRDINNGKWTTEKQQQGAANSLRMMQQKQADQESAKDSIHEAIKTFRIGHSFVLHFGDDDVTGVVTKVQSTWKPGDRGNPMTPGKWKISFALAAGARHVTLPLTELWHERESRPNDELVGEHNPNPNLHDIFDPNKIGTSRMDVHIAQGNLLGAFNHINGELINFTDHDGKMQQGILLPKRFNPARDLKNHQRMFSAKGITEFLRQNRHVTDVSKYGVFNGDETLALKHDAMGNLVVEAKNGRAGERWHQDQELQALGNSTFAGRPPAPMKMVVAPKHAEAVIQHLLDKTPLFARASVRGLAEPHADIPKVEPQASIAPGQARGMAKGDIEAGIQPTLDAWKSKDRPTVEVVQSKADLPAHLQDRVTQMEARGRVRGFLDRGTNTAYLLADHLNSVDEAHQVLRHEVVGHYGMKTLLGKDYNDVLDRVTLAYPKRVVAKADAYGWDRSPENLRKAADEVLAEMAEKGKEPGFVDRMVARIAKMLRPLGIGKAITHAEIRQLLSDSNKGLMNNVDKLGPNQLKGIGKNAFGRDRGLAGKMAAVGVHSVTALNRSLDKVLQVLTDHTVKPAGRFVADKLTPLGKFIANTTPAQWLASGFISDHHLPEDVQDARARMTVNQQKMQREISTYIDKLQDLDRLQSRVAYEWMNTRSDSAKAESLINMLPEEHRVVLTQIKNHIEQLGREAVKLGQLSQESYDRNSMAYLHRSYAKYELENKGDQAARRRMVRIMGEQYKGRGMFDPVSMDKIQRSIPDEWWQHKYEAGKADKGLKGQVFLRLERRDANGDPTENLEGINGQKPKGRLREIVWWPKDLARPAHLDSYHLDGEWEVRDTKGDKAVMWRDFSPEERQLMGELDEVKYGVARTLSMMSHDIETGRYLDYISKNHSEAMEPETGRIISDPWKFGAMGKDGDWVKVPTTEIGKTGGVKKYGNLAGRYVPISIWNDLASMNRMARGHSTFMRAYQKLMGMWKVNKTALSPSVHLNNVMANFIFADMHDVTPDHMMKAADIMFGRMNPEKQAWINRYQDSGAMHGNFVSEELRKQNMQPLIDAMREELGHAASAGNSPELRMMKMGAFASHLAHLRFTDAFTALSPKAGKVARAVGNVNDLLKRLYGHEDDFFRMAAFIKSIEEGKSDKEAGKLARDAFLNYHINAPIVNMMRQTAWPFFAFPYRAAPMLAKAVMNNPHKLLKYAMLGQLLNWAVYSWLGSNGDEDKERAMLRDEKSGKVWGVFPKLIRMPWGNSDNPEFLDVRRFLPLGDIYEMSPSTAMPVPSPLFPSGPLYTLLAEMSLNRSAFTNSDITNLNDQATTKHALDYFNYAYRSWMPNAPWMPNSYSQLSLYDALKGKTGPFGERQSMFDSIASSFGLKLASYPVNEQMFYAKKELQSLRRSIGEDKSKDLRNIEQHPGDQGVRQAAIEDIKAGNQRYVDALKAFEAKRQKMGNK